MIKYYLSNNNETCYNNFSPTFCELNGALHPAQLTHPWSTLRSFDGRAYTVVEEPKIQRETFDISSCHYQTIIRYCKYIQHKCLGGVVGYHASLTH